MVKAKNGDVRPVYQQSGWEVCRKEADKEDDEEWVQTDSVANTEILSYIFKQKEKKD